MAVRNILQLISANVAAAAQTVDPGGVYQLAITGTLGGATLAFQILGPDGTTYGTYPGLSLGTLPVIANVEIPVGASVRMTVTGGTPSALNATASWVR